MARELEVHDDDDNPPHTSGNEGLLLGRRSYLQMAGAATAALATGAVGTAAAVSEKNYDNVVNVVEAGADNSGGESIDDVLSEHVGDNTMMKFPKGTYKLDGLSESGLKNFAMVAPEGATLIPGSKDILRFKDARGVHVEGFDVDGAARVIIYAVEGQNTLKNWRLLERQEQDTHGSVLQCVNEDTVVTLENVDFSKGGEGTATWIRPPIKGDYPSGENVVDLEPSGTINFINCKMEAWDDEGLYASAHPGPLNVIGGRYANNNLAQVRTGGVKARVKGVEIVCDDVSATPRDQNMRGIWMKEGHVLTIEDCDIIMEEVPYSSGAIVNGVEGAEMHVKNTRIQTNTDAQPIYAKSPKSWPFRAPSQDEAPPSRKIVVENVNITGDAPDDAAIQINGRDGSTIENVCIQQGSGDGIKIVDADGVTVANASVNVPGETTAFSGAQVDTKNVTESASCPAPKLDGKPVDAAGNLNSPSDADGSEAEDEKSNAEGEKSADSGLPNVISIRGDKGLASYELTVEGKLEPSEADGGSPNSEDNIKGSTAEGAVNGGVDSYAFSGQVTDFQFTEGSATVAINGEEVDPSALGADDEGRGSDAEGAHVLSIRGDRGLASYELTVDGKLEPSDAEGATFDSEDNIKGSTAEGAVNGGVDSYAFSGQVTDFRFTSGAATVLLDGEEVDPSTLGADDEGRGAAPDDERPHVVVIDGTDGNGESRYEFSVSGSIEKSTVDGATVDEDDAISGSAVSGSVFGGKDAYRFSGEITQFRLDGSATINLQKSGAE
ncbi:putative sodium/potassium/calcium exchanger [Halegenticoccus soli]|uniref:right-handed parallel beta-helix repeat-containing protein n=1 Tax=Halegenticoccus soli TaxID=1985678 RepID=UPI0011798CEF|nr:right-handed parallel beta-helix repeat-containing protein [Halegenticoccus soli]